MAKLRPLHAQAELEEKMGFKIEESILADDQELFYSSLEPVPIDLLAQAEKEFEEFVRMRHAREPEREKTDAGSLPELGVTKVCPMMCGVYVVNLTHIY